MSATIMAWIDRLLLSFVSPALPRMRLSPDEDALNPVMIQFFTWEAQHPDMSWWKHFEHELPRLKELGFTQVWLPPPNKAMHGKHGQGYDAYDLWDLGEFDQKGTVSTRWGTREELLDAFSAARQHNIGVLIDAVLNHKLGADRTEMFPAIHVDSENRLRDLGPESEISGWTVFDFPGRQGKYSKMRWTQEHFTGVDWDERTQTLAIYRIAGNRHKGWSNEVDTELGNYDYLLGSDIDHRHPAVRDDLFAWGSWILDVTGGNGFRLDAVKHIHRSFLVEFIERARSVAGRERLFVVSECWTANVRKILPYMRAFGGQSAFFDVPLHENFHQASKLGSSFDLRRILNNSILEIRPQDAVTFVDNHDTVSCDSPLLHFIHGGNSANRAIVGELGTWARTLRSTLTRSFCYVAVDSRKCVFYGDLYSNQECFYQDTSDKIHLLLTTRKLFAHGALKDYFQHRNCIGFVRAGNSTYPGCVVVLSNESDDGTISRRVRMNVGSGSKGAVYRGIFDTSRRITMDRKGWGDFYCSCGAVEVWIRDADKPASLSGAVDK